MISRKPATWVLFKQKRKAPFLEDSARCCLFTFKCPNGFFRSLKNFCLFGFAVCFRGSAVLGKGKKKVKKSNLKGKSGEEGEQQMSKGQKGKKVLKQIKQPQNGGKDRAYGFLAHGSPGLGVRDFV